MSQWKLRGVRHLIHAAGYSLKGLRFALRNEAAFRQELVAVALLAPAALWLEESGVQRALLLGSLMIVLITELLNTAIEAAVDRVGQDHHNLSACAKDVGSAAVFAAIVNAMLIWCLVLM